MSLGASNSFSMLAKIGIALASPASSKTSRGPGRQLIDRPGSDSSVCRPFDLVAGLPYFEASLIVRRNKITDFSKGMVMSKQYGQYTQGACVLLTKLM